MAAGPHLTHTRRQTGCRETPNRSRVPTAPADDRGRRSPPAPAVANPSDDCLAASPSRPPTLMTHHGIAQSVEKRNPNSPENRPRTRVFLQKRLFQTRCSAARLNGVAVLHSRLKRQPQGEPLIAI